MRALVLTDFWRLDVQQLPDPVPQPREIVLQVLATGICGSDIHGFTGANGRRQPGQVMGHELVGRIARLGDSVTGLTVGELATVNPVLACGACARCRAGQGHTCPNRRLIGVDASVRSGFAELMAAPAANVVPLPATMPVEYGALVEPLSVGYHALRRGDCAPGRAVVVIGGGPIGQACVLAARRLGARSVLVSEPDAHRRALNERLGAVAVHPDELPAAVSDPPDIVVDAVGLSATVAAAFDCAPLGATIVLVGMGTPRLDLAAFEITTKERSVVGSFCYTFDEFRDTAAWVGTAPPELAGLIEDRRDLDAAQAAFTELARGESAASKIVIRPNG